MSRIYLFLGTFLAAAATATAMVLLVDPVPNDPFPGLHLSAPEQTARAEDEVLGAATVRYSSETMRYAIVYPGTWTLDDSKMTSEQDVLRDPDDRVTITISQTKNPARMTQEGILHIDVAVDESMEPLYREAIDGILKSMDVYPLTR